MKISNEIYTTSSPNTVSKDANEYSYSNTESIFDVAPMTIFFNENTRDELACQSEWNCDDGSSSYRVVSFNDNATNIVNIEISSPVSVNDCDRYNMVPFWPCSIEKCDAFDATVKMQRIIMANNIPVPFPSRFCEKVLTKQSSRPTCSQGHTTSKKRVHFYNDACDQGDPILQNDHGDEDYGYYLDCSVEEVNYSTNLVSVTVYQYVDESKDDESLKPLLYWSKEEIEEMKSEAKTDGYICCFELATLCDQLLELYVQRDAKTLSFSDCYGATSPQFQDYRVLHDTTNLCNEYPKPDRGDGCDLISPPDELPSWTQTVYEWSDSPSRGLESKVSHHHSTERRRIVSSILECYRYLQQQQRQHDRSNPKMRKGLYVQRKGDCEDIHERVREHSLQQTKLAREFAYKLAVGDSLVVKS